MHSHKAPKPQTKKQTQNSRSLAGQVCLITGGAGLLGSQFSTVLVRAGATVVVLDTNKTKGQALVKRLNKSGYDGQAVFETCDIVNEKMVRRIIPAIARRFKKIDALVNNAYPRNSHYGRKFEDVTYHDFCENINFHLGGYFLITHEVVKVFKQQKQGSIVNMGSIYGFRAPRFDLYRGTDMTMPVEYAAIKGAIINLTKYLASYLGKYAIRVNAISPGGVANRQPARFKNAYIKKVLVESRLAKPDDISGALLFLLSDEAKYITGHNLIVDGGWSL